MMCTNSATPGTNSPHQGRHTYSSKRLTCKLERHSALDTLQCFRSGRFIYAQASVASLLWSASSYASAMWGELLRKELRMSARVSRNTRAARKLLMKSFQGSSMVVNLRPLLCQSLQTTGIRWRNRTTVGAETNGAVKMNIASTRTVLDMAKMVLSFSS